MKLGRRSGSSSILCCWMTCFIAKATRTTYATAFSINNVIPTTRTTTRRSSSSRTRVAVGVAEDTTTTAAAAGNSGNSGDSGDTANSGDYTPPNALSFSKQHLYGKDLMDDEEESSLPLPSTYVTCGKCKSLFAIAEEDLGTRGKGCRVKCSVCSNSWYQSRDRLLTIPTSTHDLLPTNPSDLDRIARNLAKNTFNENSNNHQDSMMIAPDFMGISKLYVGNLSYDTTAQDLFHLFDSHLTDTNPDTTASDDTNGKDEKVCDVSLVTFPDGRSRGFAFVTFYEEQDGKKALELNGQELDGRQLTVKEPNH